MRKAVFITRDTYNTNVEIWSAHVGIRKEHDCVNYFSAGKKSLYKTLFKAGCIEKYGSYPKGSSAYLVEPKGRKDWKWTRIDNLMAFSTEDDQNSPIPADDILWL